MSSVKASARTTTRTMFGALNSVFNAVGQVASVVERSAASLNTVTEGAQGSAVVYRDTTLQKAAFNSVKTKNKLAEKLKKKDISEETFNNALDSLKEELS